MSKKRKTHPTPQYTLARKSFLEKYELGVSVAECNQMASMIKDGSVDPSGIKAQWVGISTHVAGGNPSQIWCIPLRGGMIPVVYEEHTGNIVSALTKGDVVRERNRSRAPFLKNTFKNVAMDINDDDLFDLELQIREKLLLEGADSLHDVTSEWECELGGRTFFAEFSRRENGIINVEIPAVRKQGVKPSVEIKKMASLPVRGQKRSAPRLRILDQLSGVVERPVSFRELGNIKKEISSGRATKEADGQNSKQVFYSLRCLKTPDDKPVIVLLNKNNGMLMNAFAAVPKAAAAPHRGYRPQSRHMSNR